MIGVKGIALCLAKGQQSSRAGGLPVLTLTGAPPQAWILKGSVSMLKGPGAGGKCLLAKYAPFIPEH